MNCGCHRDDQNIDVMDIEMTDDGFEWWEFCSRCSTVMHQSIDVEWHNVREAK